MNGLGGRYRKLGAPGVSQATEAALCSVWQPARLPTAPAGAKNVSARTKTPRPPTPSVPLTKLLGQQGLTGTQLLLALATTKASTLCGSTSTSSTTAATSTTAAAASTAATAASANPTAATEAPTPATIPTSTATPSASSTTSTAAPTVPSTTLAPLALAVVAPPTRSRRSPDLHANEVDSSSTSNRGEKGDRGAPLRERAARVAARSTYSNDTLLSCSRGAGGGRGRGRGGRGSREGGAANVKNGENESESRDNRFPGQFFFMSTQAPGALEKDEIFEEPAAVGKVTLHSLDYWVINRSATYSMTPLAHLLTELEPSPVKHVTSALGQRAEVKGMGKAMFKGADGRCVSTKGEAVGSGYGANDGAKAKDSNKCKPGGTSKQCELEESGAAAKEQHKGEENPKAAAEEEYGESMWGTIASAAFSNPTSATRECDWLTLHRKMGHVALSILQQLVKTEMVAGIRVKGEPDEVLGCPTCMQAKFTRYPFSSSEATAKAPLDEVVMDVVGPLKHGAAGVE
ncbi:unnamed protein product [Closterium sp. NIES-54]